MQTRSAWWAGLVISVLMLGACGEDAGTAASPQGSAGTSEAGSGGEASGNEAGSGGSDVGAGGSDGSGAGSGGSGQATAGTSGEGGSSTQTPGGFPAAPGGATGQAVPEALASKLVGRWAMRSKTATVTNAPLIGETKSVNVAYGLARIEAANGGLQMAERGCRVVVESSSPVVTTIPDAVPLSVPERIQPLLVWEEGGVVRFYKPITPTAIGANLSDPVNEALPTSVEDPRVVDQDKDGQGGVTVKIGGLASGDIYVAQRIRVAYGGVLGGDGKLLGGLLDQGEQSVLGSSNPLLNQNVPNAQDKDPAKSTVELVRIDEELDCAGLLAKTAALFP